MGCIVYLKNKVISTVFIYYSQISDTWMKHPSFSVSHCTPTQRSWRGEGGTGFIIYGFFNMKTTFHYILITNFNCVLLNSFITFPFVNLHSLFYCINCFWTLLNVLCFKFMVVSPIISLFYDLNMMPVTMVEHDPTRSGTGDCMEYIGDWCDTEYLITPVSRQPGVNPTPHPPGTSGGEAGFLCSSDVVAMVTGGF